MTELEMYELWCTLRLWANYNQLNQTIEKNWLSNSFNSHILDLLDKEEIKYRSEKRLLGYRNKGKRRLAGNANQPIIINIDVMLAKRKMSVTELSERVGITMANISVLKNGKAKAVKISTLNSICKALDCQPGDILEYVEDGDDENDENERS